ncbi:LVIVD repeat-containing protein [Haloarcula brevis]|uniref:LVIVD repeat-containing protein n=1 Tax=Haloarcula brevis TaxID=3111453 RepID=UPI00300EBFD9
MRRRTVLRRLALAGTGVGLATGTARAHPTPTGDGTAEPAASDTPTGGDPLGVLEMETVYEVVTSPDGHTAYVATGDGIALVDLVTPTSPRLLSRQTDLLAEADDGPIQRVQDLAVSGSRLLAAGPANPADGAHGVVVFDVSDRREPARIASLELDTRIHNCDFDGRYAYLTANDRDGNPLLVVDTETEREVGEWSLLDAGDAWHDVPTSLWPLHDVWVQNDRAYLAYWDGGTWVVDVSDPTDISLVAKVRGRDPETLAAIEDPGTERSEPPGNDHFVTVDDDASLLGVGGESWDLGDDDSGGPSGIELYDISDPADAELLSTLDPPPTSDPSPGGILTTAHNFELTADRCYSAWYNGGVRVHDLTDPTAPEQVFEWRDTESTSFWTAQRAAGCFVAACTDANGGTEVQPGLYTFPDPRIRTPTADASATEEGDGTAIGVGGPGFGVGSAVAAVALAAWRARRRD